MDILGFVALVITGFTACAEFGSYAFVHPVIRMLPTEQHVQVEQGLLKTFGRIMPVLMTLCVVVAVAYAIQMNAQQGLARCALGRSCRIHPRVDLDDHLQCPGEPGHGSLGPQESSQ
jgi:hypothetical protein